MTQPIAEQSEALTDILILGHITKDLLDEAPGSGYRIGGTVSFASITALRLGRQPTILTRAAPDTDLSELPVGIRRHLLPSPTTTTFANIYTENGRIQYCYTPAAPIRADDIPETLRQPRAVLLGPLVNELGPDVAELFGGRTLVAAVPQGWLRRWDETGRIYAKPWENAAEILRHLDVLVLSHEDIEFDLGRLDSFLEHVPLVILTQDRRGCTIYARQCSGEITATPVAPRPAQQIDPTGAGDIFTAAFVVRYQETGNAVEAARFANVTASFGIEGMGVAGIPGRAQVMKYMAAHPWQPAGDAHSDRT